ncbi:carbohydrate sulfotransferase 11-like [Lytechinus variegatus]|uniref:carbohydrate sulfotransferase 11-like n=1 Tax=Lytechinus variegatus TaxID=7654 RepID=UPI001BB19D89|nr:carbohydrate sulfotransferase 11-like [Lytechinus variegatus]
MLNGLMQDDSKERLNNMHKGIFLSKLRQQQAKLIRMNYHAMMYPMNKPLLPFDEAQSLRKNVVANVCTLFEENAYGAKPPIPGHLLVDDNHHLIFCQIRKVASITWRQVLDEAANKKGSHKIQRLSTYTATERNYRLKHYTKIMFVREPILRVVSGWFDKFVRTNDRDHLNYLMRYGCDIARLAGRNVSDIELCRHDHVDEGELTGTDLLSRLREGRRLRISFEDFSRFLINGPVAIKNDMHWETYHSRCQPCQVSFHSWAP